MIHMSPRVVPVLNGLRWQPNAPEARLSATDDGLAVLMLRAHHDDPDQRTVAIFWTGVAEARFGDPNDEGRHQHPLYSNGLSDLLWAGEIIDGDACPSLRRFIIPTKEVIAEVHARSIQVIRVEPATTADDVLRMA